MNLVNNNDKHFIFNFFNFLLNAICVHVHLTFNQFYHSCTFKSGRINQYQKQSYHAILGNLQQCRNYFFLFCNALQPCAFQTTYICLMSKGVPKFINQQ